MKPILPSCLPALLLLLLLFTLLPSITTAVPIKTITKTDQSMANLRKHQPQRDSIFLWSSVAAGVGSGALASLICAPLDLIRTRLQVWHEVKHTSTRNMAIIQMLKDIVRKEGWSGCFRGISATLITVPSFWGVYFPLYDHFKRTWSQHNANPAWVHMGSAVTAGGISDVICNPMFVVRTRIQTEILHELAANHRPNTILQTIQALYREGGIAIFWRGMTANLMGLSHVAVQFPAYEQLKKTLRSHKTQESALDLLLASGLSKMTASLLTYPHEVIRSRMMDSRAANIGLVQTCRKIYAAEGLLGFYTGYVATNNVFYCTQFLLSNVFKSLPISLIRVLPNTCVTFLT